MAFTHTHPEFWGALTPVIEREVAPLGIQVVTDHFALLKGDSMLEGDVAGGDWRAQEGLIDVLSLVRKGLLWVKLSAPYRVSRMAPGYADLEGLVRALVEANPARVVWGSDWYVFLARSVSHHMAVAGSSIAVV